MTLLFSAMPRLWAVVSSLVIHVGAAAAIVGASLSMAPLDNVSDAPAITVTLVSAPESVASASETDAPQAAEPEPMPVAEPQPESPVSEEITRPVEQAETEVALAVPATAAVLPDIVPIPTSRPRPPDRRQTQAPAEDNRGVQQSTAPENGAVTGLVVAASAAMPGENNDADAQRRWLGRLAAHLERRKSYPRSALSRRLEGIVKVRFIVAPDGTIVDSQLVSSSGAQELDAAALDLLRRASPVPKPPPGANPLVTVPLDFSIRS